MHVSSLTAKKSLGQHFLSDENMCRKIVDAVMVNEVEQLLEVGPGGGALTKYFLEKKEISFKAVELDEEKIRFLKQSYPQSINAFIHEDFLNMEIPFHEKFHIAGNFPYNISSQILFKILSWKDQVACVTGMFQKEVAQRIAATPGNKVYGVLTVLIQAFFDVDYLFEVHEKCFTPPPKVKSAVLRLKPKSVAPHYRAEKDFFLLVKTAFNQRRKTLRNAVRNLFEQSILQDPIFDRRAEQLTIADFEGLTHKMK